MVSPAKPTGSHPRHPEPAVLVVSDHALIAETVAAALRSCGYRTRAGSWPDGPVHPGPEPPADAGLLLVERAGPSLVPAVRSLAGADPRTRWIVLLATPSGAHGAAALRAGAALVLPRTASLEETAAAVADVVAGRSADSAAGRSRAGSDPAGRRAPGEALSALTPTELEVLEQLHAGSTVREVAARRGVSVSTVRHHVQSVLSKLGVSSQLAAVARYDELIDEVRTVDHGNGS